MWKPSKEVLFALMVTMAALGGVSFSIVKWDNVNKGFIEAYKELGLPIIFLILSMLFMTMYVKKLTE